MVVLYHRNREDFGNRHGVSFHPVSTTLPQFEQPPLS
jgi:hypothetical protein